MRRMSSFFPSSTYRKVSSEKSSLTLKQHKNSSVVFLCMCIYTEGVNTRAWVNYLYTMTWLSYDHFKHCLASARILNYSNMLPPIFCSHKLGLEQYACIDITGLMITVPQLIGKRNTKVRKKAKHALSKDWFILNLYIMYFFMH
jgi:hypothetical protein